MEYVDRWCCCRLESPAGFLAEQLRDGAIPVTKPVAPDLKPAELKAYQVRAKVRDNLPYVDRAECRLLIMAQAAVRAAMAEVDLTRPEDPLAKFVKALLRIG
eukprot:SAG11_NODE_3561_length_2371_cov_1.840229_1_plen_102_part_00